MVSGALGRSSFVPSFALAVALAMSSFGCSGTPTPVGDGGILPGSVVDAGNYTLTVLTPATAGSCDVHAQIDGGPTFTETTADWGLAGLSFGNVYSIDLDHDGYTDLIGVSGPGRETIPTVDATGFHNLPDGGFNYMVAVLMNRPKPGGGRMFVDETLDSGLFAVRGGSSTQYRETEYMAFADLNNDGNVDAYSVVGFADTNYPTPPALLPADQNEVLLNDGHGHFTLTANQSAPSQIVQPSAYQSIFTDIDNDGSLDLFMTFWSTDAAAGPLGSQAQLLKGAGDGTFTLITPTSMLTDDAAADVNPNFGLPSPTLSNILAGTDPRPSFGAVACDLNGDGYPELLLSSYGGQSNMLYVNDGTGNYTHQLNGDGGFDGDSNFAYQDNQYYLCYCTYAGNAGTAYCAGAGHPAVECPGATQANWYPGFTDQPAMLNGNNFGASCRDMDGDGVPDLFEGTIRHWWAGQSTDASALLINQTPQSPTAGAIDFRRLDGGAVGIVFPHWDPEGWNEGVEQNALADMDNDGYPDILAPESDYGYQYTRLFKQLSPSNYQETAFAWGLINPCMSLSVVADLDRDGDLDLIESQAGYNQCTACGPGQTPADGCGGWVATSDSPAFAGWAPGASNIHIYSNSASQSSKWLEIRLKGNGQNTNATGIGARVTVTVNGVDQVQDVLGGHGIASKSDDPGVLFYGLGACDAVDSIKVRWPNKTLSVDAWANVPANHLIELKQGDPTLYGVNLN